VTPYERRVLDTVARIPPGKVMTYGDVAEMMGEGGPRAVGAVMRKHGNEVHWERVVMADGRPSPSCTELACELLVDVDTPMTPNGARVDLARARWDGRRGRLRQGQPHT
jgi:alkylated DNA nucleotide flippase Atl1